MARHKGKVFDGAKELLKDLQHYARAITNEQLKEILAEGSEAMVYTMTVNLDGHDRSGQLRKSIGYKFLREGLIGDDILGVDFGWRKLARPTKGPKKVYTSTYGPILENSHKRQLRHMHVAYDAAGEYIAELMAKRALAILDSAGDPF